MKYQLFLICSIIGLYSISSFAQKEEKPSPYEFLSTYYNQDFSPFAKRNVYLGLAFSLDSKNIENTDYLVQQVLDGDRVNFNVSLKGGYYLGDYAMVGLDLEYFEKKFEGNIFKSPDSLYSNSITRGFEITPNFRSSIPLTKNERFSFFAQLGVTYGRGNTLVRNIKNIDEVDKTYATDYNLRLGLSPGVTFFVMENFCFEVQLDVLGYELSVSKSTDNNEPPSRQVRQQVDLSIDVLSLHLGLGYYFGSKMHKK
ncbi:hypothetical protein EC396_00785 [Lutibacter sp. HS1-25]|uniref:outer membrane beta-barrel protein n=1 Tax=Lutibacter sp. HS1-25 TaxID=2485000 RepID=UPI001011F7F4|nr:outer membrane beta-barrel protein [Lutibacter sp. HS1-25]RXP64543.1 hypothetical protein EC396_00785 [Lutibacter sp. HS1-25]